MTRLLPLFALTAAVVCATVPAHADTYEYTATVDGAGLTATATFDSSSILTSIQDVAATGSYTYDGTSSAVTSVDIAPTTGDCSDLSGNPTSCVYLNATDGTTIQVNFTSSFDSVGTYTAEYDFGTLTITDLSSAATPEPSSLVLLGTGLVGFAGRYGRSRRKWANGRA